MSDPWESAAIRVIRVPLLLPCPPRARMTATTAHRTRGAGLLLHPTSLPGPYGVGDLGPSARRWVDALARARQTFWQMLPLGPVGAGDSPYQAFSAFAGNPLLVSPDDLVKDGLLPRSALAGADFPAGHVDYARVGPFKANLLAQAWDRFRARPKPELEDAFAAFAVSAADWLDDFAHFMAIKELHPEGSWTDWHPELVLREPAALDRAKRELTDAIGRIRFAQFLFFRQLDALRVYARDRDVRLIGDLPIFISADSADVWAHPELFRLDADRRPKVVAGVPPDYSSKTGQLWGNPHYDWEAMRRTRFAWWVTRIKAALRQADLVRIDHFRGFEASWEVPAGEPTALHGRWVPGPGAELFETLRTELGGLPFIAEDLGVITPEVNALREQFGLPGMRIVQFAFGGAVEERFLPHTYDHNCVAYTGTHDNDTTRGWYDKLTGTERTNLHRYAPDAKANPVRALMRLAWASVADLAVAPLQDVLDLGTEHRMNVPGTPSGNWRWRYPARRLTAARLDRLGELTETYGRSRLRGGA
ncbi:MAG TPA: 4-alpha-glucanotransferase [Gemmataceae bacterium]|nr:4-alpha-glucanotransferase [Gemmataceae bacterium]